MLAAQGLDKPPAAPAMKKDLLAAIRRMGYLQIDTIHVVARSPYLVLWSRLGKYEPRWLDELLAEGELFEYWAHAACFLPIEDYPLYRRLMLDKKGHWGERTQKWVEENKKTIDYVLNYVTEHGETRSSDFKRTDGDKGAWWNWKAEKVALEVLFDQGDLMIARRHNFHRIYNLRERVLQDWDDSKTPTYETVQKELALKAIKALGVATPEWIADYFYTPKREINDVLRKLVDEGEIYEVEIEGWPAGRSSAKQNGGWFVHKSVKSFDVPEPTYTTLLSPFDPLMNNRKRAKVLFDFDYQIECYTPAPKRKYGYFTLPILHRGKLIGRLDPKAHRTSLKLRTAGRKGGIFEIKAIHLEPDVEITDELVADVAKAIQDCATWHGTPEVVVKKSVPKEFAKLLKANM